MRIVLLKRSMSRGMLSRDIGGFFKTDVVGQRLMASVMETPVSGIEMAGEGGAWGMVYSRRT